MSVVKLCNTFPSIIIQNNIKLSHKCSTEQLSLKKLINEWTSLYKKIIYLIKTMTTN